MTSCFYYIHLTLVKWLFIYGSIKMANLQILRIRWYICCSTVHQYLFITVIIIQIYFSIDSKKDWPKIILKNSKKSTECCWKAHGGGKLKHCIIISKFRTEKLAQLFTRKEDAGGREAQAVNLRGQDNTVQYFQWTFKRLFHGVPDATHNKTYQLGEVLMLVK